MSELEVLNEEIITCTRCNLRESATRPVLGCGDLGAKYMLIGEAPGREEDAEGIPFIGLSGKRLNELLSLARIDPNDCWFTNVCRCRPPNNKTPSKRQITTCAPLLMREIALVKPSVIITLGSTPLSLFSSYGVRVMHGCQFEWELPNAH